MKERLLPQWFIDVVISLYRFTAAGFGQKVPKPYWGNFCGPFCFVFFTYAVPVLAPFVLLAVGIRLLFGKSRGEKMGHVAISAAGQLVATKMRVSALGFVVAGAIVALSVLYWEIAWHFWVVIGFVVGLAIIVYGAVFALTVLEQRGTLESFDAKITKFWHHLPKALRWGLIGICAIVVSPMILIWLVIFGFTLAYNKYCPLVRESSS